MWARIKDCQSRIINVRTGDIVGEDARQCHATEASNGVNILAIHCAVYEKLAIPCLLALPTNVS
jgi:hypothetical protein